MADITIYHNPACGTSRNVLAAIRESGSEPRIVEYLKTPPDEATLRGLLRDAGLPAHELLRAKEPLAAELGLLEPGRTDDEIIAAMLKHPVLINRPVVVTPRGTRLCRPSETVRELLG